jgi:Mn-dependent DtxR family transcriptional regulator
MEHGLDKVVLDRLHLFAEFVKRCPHCGREQLRTFQESCERDSQQSKHAAIQAEDPPQ